MKNYTDGNYYIDEDLQYAIDEFEALYGREDRGTSRRDDFAAEKPRQASREEESRQEEARYRTVDRKPAYRDFDDAGMNAAYRNEGKRRQVKRADKGRRLLIFLTCAVCLLFCGAVFSVAHLIHTIKNDREQEEIRVAAEPATTEEATTEERYDGWIADAEVMTPVMTEETISLPAADFSVFEVPESTEEEAEYDPWPLVTLNLDSVPGSINLTSPGEPEKTTQMTSTYMVLVDLDTQEIVAERECEKRIVPASMTKILTVLTARDYVSEENLNDTFTITSDIINAAQSAGLSAVGFLPGDVVTVRDLLYGTIVCSGADAAAGLAIYCCGSEEAFVERMNENVEQLGLSDTAHFTNPVGKYDDDLYCTMTDMAVILSVAMQDELLRDVLKTRIYHTDKKYPDLDMPDGFELSNWFLRRIEDKEMAGNVIGAKTGFVNQSGFCSASYYEANDGKRYVCVTGNANNSWRAIYDHVSVYRSFTK